MYGPMLNVTPQKERHWSIQRPSFCGTKPPSLAGSDFDHRHLFLSSHREIHHSLLMQVQWCARELGAVGAASLADLLGLLAPCPRAIMLIRLIPPRNRLNISRFGGINTQSAYWLRRSASGRGCISLFKNAPCKFV